MIAPGSMTGVLRAVAALPRRSRGRVVMAIAAREGEGVSTIARAAAEASAGVGVTLLLDLDLLGSHQYKAYAQQSLETGPALSEAIDGRLKGQALYRLLDPSGQVRQEERSALSFRRVGRSKLFVSGFDAHGMKEGDRLQIPTGPAYWAAMRQSCELCIVDAPALERSRVGLSVCAQMDGVVLVASGVDGSVTASLGLKSELEAAGASVLGLVYTRADSVALSLERLSFGAG